jgi:hypothetical protein
LSTWIGIAANHFDPEVRAMASEVLEMPGAHVESPAAVRGVLERRDRNRVVEGWATEVDHRGVGQIGLLARDESAWIAVGLTCDVGRGVTGVVGLEVAEEQDARSFLGECFEGDELRRVCVPAGMIEALLMLSVGGAGRVAPPVLAYWIERTVGLSFYQRLEVEWGVEEPATREGALDGARGARLVLDALPAWRDDSTLCHDLAREAVDRGRAPERDDATIRLLFERRVISEVERLRGMLFWMALVWRHERRVARSNAAILIAAELQDPAERVLSHPFLSRYCRQSLSAATLEVGGGAVDLTALES